MRAISSAVFWVREDLHAEVVELLCERGDFKAVLPVFTVIKHRRGRGSRLRELETAETRPL
jgi:hypothetical protein